ncbi:MAG: LysR substrate-binding domain-containing protein [Shinella sp.]|nr:LysR substrate-binding domain-containing protein [Shinella sp.]
MKRGRLPLTALRSFEAAGRLGSFTLAAQELFVSQAAISRQIRELEALLGRPLFERQHRKVRLTEAGSRLLEVLVQSFDRIDAGLSDVIGDPATHAVRVSVEPSFAACWLVPNLARFRALRPDIDVAIDTESRLIDFRSHEAELAIRFSIAASAWPRTQAHHLHDVRMSPVLSPALAEKGPPLASPGDLAAHMLLHEENRDVWSRWFSATGIEARTGADRGPIFADGALAQQAAVRGHGVALADMLLAADDLAAGRLVQPFALSIDHGAYWLVARDFKRLSEPAGAFASWITGAFTDRLRNAE